MNLRLTAFAATMLALIAGLLVSSPAEATSTYASVTTKYVSISSAGNGKVYLRCRATKTCKGKVSFEGGGVVKSYSVGAKKSAYVAVAVNPGSPVDPHSAGAVDKGDYDAKAGQKLVVNEDSPTNVTHGYTVTTETVVRTQQITGTLRGLNAPTDLRVDLVKTIRGGNTAVVKHAKDLGSGSTYVFNVSLGTNNSAANTYYLRISGKVDGILRTWYWRGGDNAPRGGGRYLREASGVAATKAGNFDANFSWGSLRVSGAAAGTSLTVAAPPAAVSSSASTRREYDLPYCANVYGEATSNGGTTDIDFLPSYGSDRRYMIKARSGSTQSWYGATGTRMFGSCFDVMGYGSGTGNLIAVGSTYSRANVVAAASHLSLTVKGTFSGFSPTTSGDRHVSVREKVPGVAILDAPVVYGAYAPRYTNSRTYKNVIANLRPGRYWVEIGRRTGCSAWYPSRFSNNNAYLQGLDRGSESWKTVAGKYPESARSTSHGYKPKTPPRGYKGWMYRSHCKALGAGGYSTVTVTSSNVVKVLNDYKGAVVHGHVSRTGGRTNKEMLVRLSSPAGTRVIRTDISDGGGNFYVSGLPSGKWTISVNPDSWRGISRSFTGKHSVTVTRGHSYGVGTLRLHG